MFKRRALDGDADAAYAVFLGLSRCAGAPTTESDADRLQALSAPMTDEEPLEPQRDWSPALLYEYCLGVVPTGPEEAYRFLDLAAALGNPRAQVELSGHMPPEGITSPELVAGMRGAAGQRGVVHLRENHYLEEARDAGMVDAFLGLAIVHGATAEVVRDPVAAFGYLLAADVVYQRAARPNASRPYLTALEASLRPDQLAEGRRFADRLLSDPDCCRL